MKVAYTGRQVEVSPSIRVQVEDRLNKIHKILSPRYDLEAHLVLTLEHHCYHSELSVNFRDHALVSAASNHVLAVCMQDVLDRLEKQAVRHKARWRELKRDSKTIAAFKARAAAEVEQAAADEPAGQAMPPAREMRRRSASAGMGD